MFYTSLTKKAMKISFDAHKNQKDKGGVPYVYHPFYIALQMPNEYTICTALLHDVIEDSHITEKYLITQGFPKEIVDAVSLLTHHKNTPYFDYIEKIKNNPIAKIVKIADLKHNSLLSRIDNVDSKTLKRIEKYQKALKILTEKERKNG